MGWKAERSRERIEGFKRSAPEIRVERLVEDYLPRIARERAFRAAAGARDQGAPALYDLPDGTAVVVPDAVHIYVRAISYDDVRLEQGRETEASHKRALAFLHLLYGSGDRVVQSIGAQRVDFHGARMHAVVTEPSARGDVVARIAKAIAIAREMMELAHEVERTLSTGGFPLRFRVGADVGTCIAINSGRRDDREPMFIGPAANHAAKLADGDQEGIYLSDRIRAALGLARVGSLAMERLVPASPSEFASTADRFRRSAAALRLDEWRDEARFGGAQPISPDAFSFRRHTPPLSTIDYADLSPARSVRMGLASIFADLDGYTAYVDACMRDGCLDKAVLLLHVLRSEFNAVVQRDFRGRKVRFIGDCIHALLAAGTAHRTDERETIELAAQCAGGLRSSFDLCGELVEHADRVGLAIGLEYGETPITRIGIRGDRAVRTASSLASRGSERCQRQCDGEQTMIGEKAFASASAAIRKLFGPRRVATGLTYDDVATAGSVAGAAAVAAAAILTAPAEARTSRAYSR